MIHAIDAALPIRPILPAPSTLPQGMDANMWPTSQEFDDDDDDDDVYDDDDDVD